jgi:phosphate starvation-inducible protein PhoH
MQKKYVKYPQERVGVRHWPAAGTEPYLAVACAAEALMNGEVDRIILSRPLLKRRTPGLPAGRHEGKGRSLSAPAL